MTKRIEDRHVRRRLSRSLPNCPSRQLCLHFSAHTTKGRRLPWRRVHQFHPSPSENCHDSPSAWRRMRGTAATRDRVVQVYTEDTRWRNPAEFPRGPRAGTRLPATQVEGGARRSGADQGVMGVGGQPHRGASSPTNGAMIRATGTASYGNDNLGVQRTRPDAASLRAAAPNDLPLTASESASFVGRSGAGRYDHPGRSQSGPGNIHPQRRSTKNGGLAGGSPRGDQPRSLLFLTRSTRHPRLLSQVLCMPLKTAAVLPLLDSAHRDPRMERRPQRA